VVERWKWNKLTEHVVSSDTFNILLRIAMINLLEVVGGLYKSLYKAFLPPCHLDNMSSNIMRTFSSLFVIKFTTLISWPGRV